MPLILNEPSHGGCSIISGRNSYVTPTCADAMEYAHISITQPKALSAAGSCFIATAKSCHFGTTFARDSTAIITGELPMGAKASMGALTSLYFCTIGSKSLFFGSM